MAGILRVECAFCLESGFHTSGDRLELWVNKALNLDWKEGLYPVFPATTVKGWFREGAERALRSLGIKACDASSPETICGTCLVCEVFGHPRKKSPLRFADVVIKDASRDVRMSVSLSRHRKTAYEDRLFSLEIGFCPHFLTDIYGFFNDPKRARVAALLLFVGSKFLSAVGGGKSRGLGWVKRESFSATFDGHPIPEEELLRELASLPKEVEA